MTKELFEEWLDSVTTSPPQLSIYREKTGARAVAVARIRALLADHFVGEATVAQAGGLEKAAQLIKNSIPTSKKTRSGDLAELLATELANAQSKFVVPIKKLRWKSDRQMAMRGNDVIGIDRSRKPHGVLKGECKSRAQFGAAPVSEAVKTLDAHDGRPNPSTLAFITKRLYEEKRDEEAKAFQDLQCENAITLPMVTHQIFALSGSDPSRFLQQAPPSKHAAIAREMIAIVVAEHGTFMESVYGQ